MSNGIYYFTKKQKEVENWIVKLGFRVRAEVDVEQYRADLFIKELSLIVEIDGPSHRKLKKEGSVITKDSSKISRRDATLLQTVSKIWHIPVDMEEEIFKVEFQKIIK